MTIRKSCEKGVVHPKELKTVITKKVQTFTLRSDEEHMPALTKHAVNNMASSFKPNAHPYVLSNIFTGLHAKVDLHNSLLDSISAWEEKRERFMPGAFESGEICSFYSPVYMFHADGTLRKTN